MTAQVIDGRACARALKAHVAVEFNRLRADGLGAGLAVVSVGDHFSSRIYAQRLARLATEFGGSYAEHVLPATATEQEVVATVATLSDDPEVSGILVLRPLPPHINEATVFRAINPLKDIEAVHPLNAGLLALGVPRFVPSTAASCFHLLDTWLDAQGEDRSAFYHRSLIVVVGRSNNVGKPAVSLAYERQATVQSVDEWADRTTGLGRHTRWADVLIVAAGEPGLIKAEHVSDSAIVIDVGVNPRTFPDGKIRMVGDVDYGPVASRVRAISPVPGGVGPVTDVWLLRNTVSAARILAGGSPLPAMPGPIAHLLER